MFLKRFLTFYTLLLAALTAVEANYPLRSRTLQQKPQKVSQRQLQTQKRFLADDSNVSISMALCGVLFHLFNLTSHTLRK